MITATTPAAAVSQLSSQLAASLAGDHAWPAGKPVSTWRFSWNRSAPGCWTAPRPSSPGSPAYAAPPTAHSPKAMSSW